MIRTLCTALLSMNMKLNQNKLDRQELGIQRWLGAGAKGTLQWSTGMGKTFAAILIIRKTLARNPLAETIVVVPTIQLKSQWEKEIRANRLKGVTVYVINTAVKEKRSCTLLILDEIHRFGGHIESAGSETFVQVFNFEYKFILGLSATVKRLDGLHKVIFEAAPIVDTITMDEARDAGWVSEYTEYNLGIELSPRDRMRYDAITERFNKHFAWFNHDFELAQGCLSIDSKVIKGKNRIGAKEYAEANDLTDKEVLVQAVQFHKFMRLRKEFLFNTELKKTITLEIVKKFPVKTIIFSESTAFSSGVKKELGDIAVEYHSYLESEDRVIKGKVVRYGKGRLKKEALKKIQDNRFKVRVISTAKALDQGFDVDDIELGLITSFTSNATQNIQRKGRVTRLFKRREGTKHAVIVNLYILNSQEEKWLRVAQKGQLTKKIYNIDEIELPTSMDKGNREGSQEDTPGNPAKEMDLLPSFLQGS